MAVVAVQLTKWVLDICRFGPDSSTVAAVPFLRFWLSEKVQLCVMSMLSSLLL